LRVPCPLHTFFSWCLRPHTFTIRPFSFRRSCHPRDLHSFPTRRSSDLCPRAAHCLGFGGRTGCPRPRGPRLAHLGGGPARRRAGDRKSTRLNSSHVSISYAVFCLKKKMTTASLAETDQKDKIRITNQTS